MFFFFEKSFREVVRGKGLQEATTTRENSIVTQMVMTTRPHFLSPHLEVKLKSLFKFINFNIHLYIKCRILDLLFPLMHDTLISFQ